MPNLQEEDFSNLLRFYEIFGLLILGLGAMALAAIFGGALSSGDRGRANYSDEEDFKQRMSWSTQLFLFGMPCVLSSLAIYLLNTR